MGENAAASISALPQEANKFVMKRPISKHKQLAGVVDKTDPG